MWKRGYVFAKKLLDNICIWIGSTAHVLYWVVIFTVDLLWSASVLMAFACFFSCAWCMVTFGFPWEKMVRTCQDEKKLVNFYDIYGYITWYFSYVVEVCESVITYSLMFVQHGQWRMIQHNIQLWNTHLYLAGECWIIRVQTACRYISTKTKCVCKDSTWKKSSYVRAPIANIAKVKKLRVSCNRRLDLERWRTHNVILIRWRQLQKINFSNKYCGPTFSVYIDNF